MKLLNAFTSTNHRESYNTLLSLIGYKNEKPITVSSVTDKYTGLVESNSLFWDLLSVAFWIVQLHYMMKIAIQKR